MATELASLVVRLEADSKKLQRDLAKVEQRLGKTERAGLNVQKAMAAMAGAAGFAFAAKKAFDLGAAVEETGSKFRTVFGQSSKDAQAFIDDFATMAGLSAVQAQEVLATTGAIVQGMGFAQDASAEFAEEVVRLAGDFASFNNIPITETALAVQSALTGERESLKRLGVVILETDVQQRALAMSGKESAKALTQQEKATATLQLITERAGVAVGDLGRTQDSAANRARALAAGFRTMQEELATAVMPAFGELMGMLEDSMPMIQRWADAFQGAISDLRDAIDLPGVLAAEQVAGLSGATLDELKQKAAGLAEQIRRMRALVEDETVDVMGMAVVTNKEGDAAVKALAGYERALREVNERIRTFGDETEHANEQSRQTTEALRTQAEAAREAAAAQADFNAAMASGVGFRPGGLPSAGGTASETRLRERERTIRPLDFADVFDLEGIRGSVARFSASLDETDEAAESLAEQMGPVVSGVVAFADGLGLVDGATRDALRGISDLIGGIAGLKRDDAGDFDILASLPGLAGIAGGVVGAIDAMFGESNQQKIREAERAFDDAMGALEGFGQAVSEEARLSATAFDALDAAIQAQIVATADSMEDLKRAHGATQTFQNLRDAGMGIEEIARVLEETFGVDAQAVLDAYHQHMQRIEEMRRREIEAMRDQLSLQLLEARGDSEALERARMELRHQEMLVAAFESGDAAILALTLQIIGMETAALEAARAAEEAAEQQRKVEEALREQEEARRQMMARRLSMLDIEARAAALAGDDRLALQKELQAAAEREIEQARRAVRAGEMSKAAFERLVGVIEGEVNQALKEFERQAQAAAEAERFRQMMDKENLRVRLLVAQGLDAEADALRNQIELQEALNEGRDAEYIALLRQIHATERQREAVDETTRAIDGMTRALNAPAGLRLELLRHRASDPAFTGGGGSGGRGFDRVFNTGGGGGGGGGAPVNITVNAAPGQSAEQIAREVRRVWEREARSGGSPLLLSEN